MTHEYEPPSRPSETRTVRVRYFDSQLGEYQEKLVTEAEEHQDFCNSLSGRVRQYQRVPQSHVT